MTYIKTPWKDRVVEKPMTFTMQNNPDGTITLFPAEGQIVESGTPITAAYMNNLESQYDEVAKEFVPYTGATKDVDLNKKAIKNAQLIDFQDTANDGVFWRSLEGNLAGRSGNAELRSYNSDGSLKSTALSVTPEGIASMLLQPFVSARANGLTQSVSSGVDTKVTIFGTEDSDTQSEFASNRYTAKTDGIYLIRAWFDWGGSPPTTDSQTRLYKNGASVGSMAFGQANQRYLSNSYAIKLTAGEYLEIYALQNSGGTAKTLSNATLTITKLS